MNKVTVVIGNPPYNAHQKNENDNNKNRKYPIVDDWVKTTYAKDSKATNKNALSDPYVKAIRWASNRIKGTGIVALVTNNSFLEDSPFDGMRKHLSQDFNKVYCLDLGGNVRKNPKLSGTTHNVFGIQVGVSINLLIRNQSDTHEIYYARLDEFWKKGQKYDFLESKQKVSGVEWQRIEPDKNETWLTEGLHTDFDDFIPIGTKQAKAVKDDTEGVFFKIYSGGIKTNRDAWAYNFNRELLAENMQKTIKCYNEQVFNWTQLNDKTANIDDFVLYDDKRISWDSTLKNSFKKQKFAIFTADKIRYSLYRPFVNTKLYFDRFFNNSVHRFPSIFPTPDTEKENRVICLSAIGNSKNFHSLIVNIIPDIHFTGDSQCFPFYTYSEDGTGRTENITDWILNHCQNFYNDKSLNKWDIFYFIYGLLHSFKYRTKYASNLKRELPRLPLVKDFRLFSEAGKQLADLHINYETQPEYDKLERVYNHSVKQSLRVEKMRLSKDKTQLKYNDFLTLKGIPTDTFDYRLGNRSALEWIVDQYRVKVDKRSGIENDPNRSDDPQYILKLIGQIITVSLETVKIVKDIEKLEIG